MTLKIKTDYSANSGNYGSGTNSCDYIVVHYTANTASALNEAKNCQNNVSKTSFHYVLDGSECYQLLADKKVAWAVGAPTGKTAYVKNKESISIEVCSDGSAAFTDAEVSMLAELVQSLMAKHSIDADHVVRHYDCHSGHKACPAWYCGSTAKDARWDALKADICGEGTGTATTAETASTTATAASASLSVDGLWGVETTKALQTALGTTVDGTVSSQSASYRDDNPGLLSSSWEWLDSGAKGSPMVKALQKKVGATQDGLVGPKTIKALQKALGTTQDGCISKPSACVKALQKALNAGTF